MASRRPSVSVPEGPEHSSFQIGADYEFGEGETVTVAVKAPNGYVLRGFNLVDVPEPKPGGGFTAVPTWMEADDIERHTVYGYAANKGELPLVPVRWGYAMNEGVPAKTWVAWLRANLRLPAVVNGLIFAFKTPRDAEDEAKNMESGGIRDGLEPMQIDVFDSNGNVTSRDPRAPVGLPVGRADVVRVQ